MKKIIILATFLLNLPAFAQISSTNVRNYGDIASSPAAVSIAPGVSIIPPWWAKNLSEANSNQNPTTTSNKEDMKNQTILIPPPASVDANAQSEVFKKATEQKTTIAPAPVASSSQTVQNLVVIPKEIKKPAIVVTDISSWNRTTQKEIEDKANLDLQQQYQKFLMQK